MSDAASTEKADDKTLVTPEQLIMASMRGDVKLEDKLKDRLTRYVQADKDKKIPEYDPGVGMAVLAVLDKPDATLTADTLVKSDIGGKVTLDVDMRRIASEVVRGENPGKAGSWSKEQPK